MFFQWKVLTPAGSTTCNTVHQLKKERIEKILLCHKCRLAGKRCRKILWKIFQDLKQKLRDSNVTFHPAENSPIFLGCALSNFKTWHPFKINERGSNLGKRLRGAPKSVERRVVQDLSLFGLTPLRGSFGLKDPREATVTVYSSFLSPEGISLYIGFWFISWLKLQLMNNSSPHVNELGFRN